MGTVSKKVLAVLISLCLVSSIVNQVFADNGVSSDILSDTESFSASKNGIITYSEYLEANGSYTVSDTDISVVGASFFEAENGADVSTGSYKNAQNALIWNEGNGSVSWKFVVKKAGLYNFKYVFLPLKGGNNLEYTLLLDREIPFDGADSLVFTRDWKNRSEKHRTDKQGNELSSEQCETGEFVTRLAVDDTGVEIEPYCFALSVGEHTVTLVGNGYPVAIASVNFVAPEKTVKYKEAFKNYDIDEDDTVKPIVIHAEDAVVKSDNSLIAKASNGNAGMYPIHPYLTKINNIGGSSWSTAGQSITWKFTAEKSGYYSFGARYKQNELIGGESWRWLTIDGKTPFEEAKELRFAYDTGWQEYVFADGDKPYYIYLEKGEHTLSLAVTLGEISEYYYRMNKVVTALGDMYLEMVMITGETPDVNRDYDLFSQIPGLSEVLTEFAESLELISRDMKKLSGNNGNQYTAAVNNMKRVIAQMLEARFIAHLYVQDYYTNYTTLSSWLGEMRKMPLALDEMQFVYAGGEFDWNDPNIFVKLFFGIKRLLYSYTKDYISESDEGSLKLWVNWGRDQTLALDSLIRESFTEETGIKVELQIVSNSLINGLLANNFPDLQLHLARTDPVNYGMRGALVDLTQFSDHKEVLQRFMKGADTPYWYNGALYALPDTQTFYCMFYRTDVFAELGLEPPATWDEFLHCATIIQRYNMNVYVPYTQIATTTTVNSGIGSLNLYPTLMMQRDISLYNRAQDRTNLITADGIQVFEEWLDMYTDYGYLKEADFYNRFRNGSMPLGIAPYTTYMTIYSAAPEIQGRWSVANVPATRNGNAYVAGGGTGCSIVKESKHQREAWEFLKWWTSEEIQSRYSNNVESILGMLGRISTSNVEAFKKLSWKPEDLNKLLAQWENVREVPEVPGSYYLTRAVDQAYWAVINDAENPKDSITEWSKVADNEIARKIKEYS